MAKKKDNPEFLDDPNLLAPGKETSDAIEKALEAEEKAKETQAQKLLKIAMERYRFGQDELHRPFAVPLGGSGVVRYFGKGESELMNELAREFYRAHQRPPSTNALSESRSVLAGMAQEEDPEPVYMRVAREPGPSGGIVVDMGDAEERAVIVRSSGWEMVDKSPILFRRTDAMLPFPEPVRGGSLDELDQILNVRGTYLGLVKAFIVLGFVPNIQHAVLYINGEHGSAKSDTTKMIVQIMDPTAAPLRSKPRDDQTWSVAANASWVVSLENMSRIPEWLSDNLCRAVTGDGVLERKLYTNDGVSIRAFRRILVLNGIEIDGLRPDLADRMFVINLKYISDENRRGETEVAETFEAMRGRVFGGVLDKLVEVLRVVDTGKHITKTVPRMADFAYYLRAVDIANGDTKNFQAFGQIQKRQSADLAEGDVVGAIIRKIVTSHGGHWKGTAADLLVEIDTEAVRYGKNRGIPKRPEEVSNKITRISPNLREAGWEVKKGRSNGRRIIELTAPPSPEEAPDKEDGGK